MQPWLTKVAIDEHIARGDLAGVGRVAALFLAVLAGVFLLEFAQTWISQSIGQGIMFEMRMAIYGHLQRVDVAFYDRHAVGRLMTRVTSDVDALNDLFSAGVVAVFGDAFMLAGIIGVVLWMDWRLALVTFSVLPLIVLVTHWFRRHVRESYRRVRGWVARINAFLQENLTGMATVQLFRREALNFERFEAINRGHRDANVEAIFYYAVFYPAIEAVAALAAALIIVAGGHWVGTGTLTIGALAAFLQYAQRFFRPISDMSEKFNLLQAAMASSERIFALLDTPVTVASPAAPAPRPPGARGHIVFDHVWFAYGVDAATAAAAAAGKDDVNWVLRDVSFEVPAGQRVGIVGATGAGKTTIISLLLRFYDVQRGRILVDGVDIRELDLADLRGICGLVLQDVYLFSGSIVENVRLGRPWLTRADDRARRRRRPRRPFRGGAAGGPRHARGGARRLVVGRPEAAAVVRPGAGRRSGRPRPRRGDVERRHRNRAADPRRPARPHGRPDDHRHRPSAVDDPGRRSHPGLPPRRAARVRLAPGAADAARPLRAALPAPVPRSGRPIRLACGRARAASCRSAGW